MRSNWRRVSIPIVLAALFALPPACSAPGPESSSSTGAPGTAGAPAARADDGRALLALLPDSAAAPGWTRKEEDIRSYGADNLWDFINGGAEAYLACGFEEVVTSEYVTPAQPNGILMDIYRMKDAAGAFGIYSRERHPDYDFRPIGAEGYLAGTAFNFWANAYYVKLTAFEESDGTKAAMVQLAEAVSRQLGPPGPTPTSSSYERCGPAKNNP